MLLLSILQSTFRLLLLCWNLLPCFPHLCHKSNLFVWLNTWCCWNSRFFFISKWGKVMCDSSEPWQLKRLAHFPLAQLSPSKGWAKSYPAGRWDILATERKRLIIPVQLSLDQLGYPSRPWASASLQINWSPQSQQHHCILLFEAECPCFEQSNE